MWVPGFPPHKCVAHRVTVRIHTIFWPGVAVAICATMVTAFGGNAASAVHRPGMEGGFCLLQAAVQPRTLLPLGCIGTDGDNTP